MVYQLHGDSLSEFINKFGTMHLVVNDGYIKRCVFTKDKSEVSVDVDSSLQSYTTEQIKDAAEDLYVVQYKADRYILIRKWNTVKL